MITLKSARSISTCVLTCFFAVADDRNFDMCTSVGTNAERGRSSESRFSFSYSVIENRGPDLQKLYLFCRDG